MELRRKPGHIVGAAGAGNFTSTLATFEESCRAPRLATVAIMIIAAVKVDCDLDFMEVARGRRGAAVGLRGWCSRSPR